jgi:RNA polymerase sigma factor (sigma-70 family)
LNSVDIIDEVIAGCKNNNQRTQEQLYRSYYRVMMSLCLRYTKNEVDALDVLNTGFYKVYKNIHTFNKNKATLYTWIRTIIINSCLDFIKAKQQIIDTKEIEQAANIDVPPAAVSKLSANEILQLVRSLPNATQAVFNLYAIEGYTHTEIGKLLNISEGTSKWHLSEARKKLQKMINEQTI